MNAAEIVGDMAHSSAGERRPDLMEEEDADALQAMPGHLVRRAQQISTALFAEECGGYDLTSVQYAALVAIRDNPDIDATRLSALIAFDRSTLGDVLERLEVKGWIARNSAPRDRRVKRVTLTAVGQDLLEEVGPAVRRVQERLVAPLDPADRTLLMKLLTRLTDRHGAAETRPLRLITQP